MGNTHNSIYRYIYPELYPDKRKPPTFDPNFGFKNGRKLRELPMTVDDLTSLGIPDAKRTYCADKYVAHRECIRKEFPFVLRCRKTKHAEHECNTEDLILRHMEFERERRLLQRKARLSADA
ncbi:hypothetical protein ACOME3_009142 [Neoechinorhynchus agilis]